MKTVISGAGIGGLVLARALRQAGDDVEVHERDTGIDDTSGYRLHLGPAAVSALERHLPPTSFEALLASSPRPVASGAISVTDRRLRRLTRGSANPCASDLLVDRRRLREVLLHGLEDCVRWSSPVTGHAEDPTSVTVQHAGGTSRADLLVGADGIGSAVVRSILGHGLAQRLGVSGLAGRTPADAVPGLVARAPGAGLLAFAPRGVGLFLSVHDPGPVATVRTDREPEEPVVIWSAIATDRRIAQDGEDPLRLLVGFHPLVLAAVRASDPDSTSRFAFHAADPSTETVPWSAGRVTALGDAVHAMPPTGGQGATTAIRDAAVLAEALAPVRRGERTVPVALAHAHRSIASYAPAAVASSLRPVHWIRRLDRVSRPFGHLRGRVA